MENGENGKKEKRTVERSKTLLKVSEHERQNRKPLVLKVGKLHHFLWGSICVSLHRKRIAQTQLRLC